MLPQPGTPVSASAVRPLPAKFPERTRTPDTDEGGVPVLDQLAHALVPGECRAGTDDNGGSYSGQVSARSIR